MRIRIDLKILIFLLIFYFTNQIRIYLIIMLFSVIHEMGHIVVGLILKLRPYKIEIMPVGLNVAFYSEINNKYKEILISLAGPITNFILAIICQHIDLKYMTTQEAVYSNLLILLFNIIPIYPLDGGRIIKGILDINVGIIKSEKIINRKKKITIIILTIISSITVYYYKNFAIFLTCIFLWNLVLREKSDKTLAILRVK